MYIQQTCCFTLLFDKELHYQNTDGIELQRSLENVDELFREIIVDNTSVRETWCILVEKYNHINDYKYPMITFIN